jgi:hypothetical protein
MACATANPRGAQPMKNVMVAFRAVLNSSGAINRAAIRFRPARLPFYRKTQDLQEKHFFNPIYLLLFFHVKRKASHNS